MYSIQTNYSDPFHETISTFIKSEFPVLLKPKDKATLDLLTDAIIASNKVRFGPKPTPEGLVAIRQVISHWTEKEEPIPFLIGWGSEKPNGSGVDIAELFALKTLICLNSRVQQYYWPGVKFHVRIEDVSAPHLFFDRMEQARTDALLYTSGFVNLTKVIGVSHFIKALPESTFVSEPTFNKEADAILPAMQAHVCNPTDKEAMFELDQLGWHQPLSAETIAFWMERYAKQYPDRTEEQRKHILARYFAGALARIRLNITGKANEWGNNFMELSFVQPTPGISANRALKRIYYRTMSSDITSNHMPAWRAKGYLRICAEDEISAALTSFNSAEQFNENLITLSNDGLNQPVQADYMIL